MNFVLRDNNAGSSDGKGTNPQPQHPSPFEDLAVVQALLKLYDDANVSAAIGYARRHPTAEEIQRQQIKDAEEAEERKKQQQIWTQRQQRQLQLQQQRNAEQLAAQQQAAQIPLQQSPTGKSGKGNLAASFKGTNSVNQSASDSKKGTAQQHSANSTAAANLATSSAPLPHAVPLESFLRSQPEELRQLLSIPHSTAAQYSLNGNNTMAVGFGSDVSTATTMSTQNRLYFGDEVAVQQQTKDVDGEDDDAVLLIPMKPSASESAKSDATDNFWIPPTLSHVTNVQSSTMFMNGILASLLSAAGIEDVGGLNAPPPENSNGDASNASGEPSVPPPFFVPNTASIHLALQLMIDNGFAGHLANSFGSVGSGNTQSEGGGASPSKSSTSKKGQADDGDNDDEGDRSEDEEGGATSGGEQNGTEKTTKTASYQTINASHLLATGLLLTPSAIANLGADPSAYVTSSADVLRYGKAAAAGSASTIGGASGMGAGTDANVSSSNATNDPSQQQNSLNSGIIASGETANAFLSIPSIIAADKMAAAIETDLLQKHLFSQAVKDEKMNNAGSGMASIGDTKNATKSVDGSSAAATKSTQGRKHMPITTDHLRAFICSLYNHTFSPTDVDGVGGKQNQLEFSAQVGTHESTDSSNETTGGAIHAISEGQQHPIDGYSTTEGQNQLLWEALSAVGVVSEADLALVAKLQMNLSSTSDLVASSANAGGIGGGNFSLEGDSSTSPKTFSLLLGSTSGGLNSNMASGRGQRPSSATKNGNKEGDLYGADGQQVQQALATLQKQQQAFVSDLSANATVLFGSDSGSPIAPAPFPSTINFALQQYPSTMVAPFIGSGNNTSTSNSNNPQSAYNSKPGTADGGERNAAHYAATSQIVSAGVNPTMSLPPPENYSYHTLYQQQTTDSSKKHASTGSGPSDAQGTSSASNNSNATSNIPSNIAPLPPYTELVADDKTLSALNTLSQFPLSRYGVSAGASGKQPSNGLGGNGTANTSVLVDNNPLFIAGGDAQHQIHGSDHEDYDTEEEEAIALLRFQKQQEKAEEAFLVAINDAHRTQINPSAWLSHMRQITLSALFSQQQAKRKMQLQLELRQRKDQQLNSNVSGTVTNPVTSTSSTALQSAQSDPSSLLSKVLATSSSKNGQQASLSPSTPNNFVHPLGGNALKMINVLSSKPTSLNESTAHTGPSGAESGAMAVGSSPNADLINLSSNNNNIDISSVTGQPKSTALQMAAQSITELQALERDQQKRRNPKTGGKYSDHFFEPTRIHDLFVEMEASEEEELAGATGNSHKNEGRFITMSESTTTTVTTTESVTVSRDAIKMPEDNNKMLTIGTTKTSTRTTTTSTIAGTARRLLQNSDFDANVPTGAFLLAVPDLLLETIRLCSVRALSDVQSQQVLMLVDGVLQIIGNDAAMQQFEQTKNAAKANSDFKLEFLVSNPDKVNDHIAEPSSPTASKAKQTAQQQITAQSSRKVLNLAAQLEAFLTDCVDILVAPEEQTVDVLDGNEDAEESELEDAAVDPDGLVSDKPSKIKRKGGDRQRHASIADEEETIETAKRGKRSVTVVRRAITSKSVVEAKAEPQLFAMWQARRAGILDGSITTGMPDTLPPNATSGHNSPNNNTANSGLNVTTNSAVPPIQGMSSAALSAHPFSGWVSAAVNTNDKFLQKIFTHQLQQMVLGNHSLITLGQPQAGGSNTVPFAGLSVSGPAGAFKGNKSTTAPELGMTARSQGNKGGGNTGGGGDESAYNLATRRNNSTTTLGSTATNTNNAYVVPTYSTQTLSSSGNNEDAAEDAYERSYKESNLKGQANQNTLKSDTLTQGENAKLNALIATFEYPYFPPASSYPANGPNALNKVQSKLLAQHDEYLKWIPVVVVDTVVATVREVPFNMNLDPVLTWEDAATLLQFISTSLLQHLALYQLALSPLISVSATINHEIVSEITNETTYEKQIPSFTTSGGAKPMPTFVVGGNDYTRPLTSTIHTTTTSGTSATSLPVEIKKGMTKRTETDYFSAAPSFITSQNYFAAQEKAGHQTQHLPRRVTATSPAFNDGFICGPGGLIHEKFTVNQLDAPPFLPPTGDIHSFAVANSVPGSYRNAPAKVMTAMGFGHDGELLTPSQLALMSGSTTGNTSGGTTGNRKTAKSPVGGHSASISIAQNNLSGAGLNASLNTAAQQRDSVSSGHHLINAGYGGGGAVGGSNAASAFFSISPEVASAPKGFIPVLAKGEMDAFAGLAKVDNDLRYAAGAPLFSSGEQSTSKGAVPPPPQQPASDIPVSTGSIRIGQHHPSIPSTQQPIVFTGVGVAQRCASTFNAAIEAQVADDGETAIYRPVMTTGQPPLPLSVFLAKKSRMDFIAGVAKDYSDIFEAEWLEPITHYFRSFFTPALVALRIKERREFEEDVDAQMDSTDYGHAGQVMAHRLRNIVVAPHKATPATDQLANKPSAPTSAAATPSNTKKGRQLAAAAAAASLADASISLEGGRPTTTPANNSPATTPSKAGGGPSSGRGAGGRRGTVAPSDIPRADGADLAPESLLDRFLNDAELRLDGIVKQLDAKNAAAAATSGPAARKR